MRQATQEDKVVQDPVQDALMEYPLVFSHHSLDPIRDSNGDPIQGPNGKLTMVELLSFIRTAFPNGCEHDLVEALNWFDHRQIQG